MIIIVAEKFSTRIAYVAEVLFGIILQTQYKVAYIDNPKNALEALSADDNNIILSYGNIPHIKADLKMPSAGLLYENEIRELDPVIKNEIGLLEIHFSQAQNFNDLDFTFDVFSAAFFWLTEYANYTVTSFDAHERYDEKQNILLREKHHSKPWVQLYAEHLWEKLWAIKPKLSRQKQKFHYLISVDVDAPYLYKHKAVWLQFAGFAKDIFKGDFEGVKTRWKVLNGSTKDPIDVFDYLLQKVKTDKLIFFFLLARHSPHDTRFTHDHPEYIKLIKDLLRSGAAIGIHPSYTSFLDKEKIKKEKEALEAIIEKAVYASRMHYLKYRLPQTRNYLLENTLLHDFTTCPVSSTGFMHGMAIAFPWFDLSINRSTNLTLNPTMAMDVTLRNYMSLSPEAAFSELKNLIAETAAVNGKFTWLIHNNTLSEYKEWRGWKAVFEKTLAYLQQKES